jgi:hypothetical protein
MHMNIKKVIAILLILGLIAWFFPKKTTYDRCLGIRSAKSKEKSCPCYYDDEKELEVCALCLFTQPYNCWGVPIE